MRHDASPIASMRRAGVGKGARRSVRGILRKARHPMCSKALSLFSIGHLDVRTTFFAWIHMKLLTRPFPLP